MCGRGGSRLPAPGSTQEVPGLTGVRPKGKVHPRSTGGLGALGARCHPQGRSVQESSGDARPCHCCGGVELAPEKVTLSPSTSSSPKGCW